MSRYFEISGFFCEDNYEFDGYILKETDDYNELEDENVFEFGWSEDDILDNMNGDIEQYQNFKITDYKEI